jgi:hypothetical protein
MGFKGLCPPGLGLTCYAEIAVVLMEVLPRLLPSMDSQVASLITVVRVQWMQSIVASTGTSGPRF